MSKKTPVTIARGDGIGPEIMDAVLHILKEAQAPLEFEEIEIGKKLYEAGHTSGISPSAWESLRRTRIFLKAPITTPQGSGYKSLNVTIRKTLGLYANVRPCVAYPPFVATRHPQMKVTIIRENEEDLYAGIEHRQTDEVTQCLKLITRPGCEKIIRYAFEYARHHGTRKITCMTKDNIMKMTDGLFHAVFNEISAEYPELEKEHLIIDIGAARLADTPERFELIVLPNLYGDILSDIAAQVAGSVGLAPSCNIGDHGAMFEAIHGSAPDIAGLNIANPSGLLLSAVMMLVHIGEAKIAEKIHNAWLKTIEDGFHTKDIFSSHSAHQCGTREFAKEIIARLGASPNKLKPVAYQDGRPASMARAAISSAPSRTARKELIGTDIFLDWKGIPPDELGAKLKTLETPSLQLKMITNRGVKVWPEGLPETFCTDHWRCRFVRTQTGSPAKSADIIELLDKLSKAGLNFIKLENLYDFDGIPGYSLGQGQ